MVGFDLTWVLSGLFLIPYLLWGIYLLRQQLLYDVELDRAVETFTFVFLILFFVFEFTLIKMWLDDSPVMLVFATLALVASAFALYGPLLMSFGSHLLVDLLMPAAKHHDDVPRYGSAESFETRGDYEGAAREYISIARQFPQERRAALAAADNLAKIGQYQVAAPWFESALELTSDADEALRIVNRLSDIYLNELDQPEEAREVLEEFVESFPNSEYLDSVQRRIENMEKQGPPPAAHPIRDTLTS